MTLQERIKSLSEYSLSFNTYDGNFVVTVSYGPSWKVKRPANEKVMFETDDEVKGLCYYATPMTEDIEEVFKCIDDVIEYNKELELKIELFNRKKEELKSLFRNEPISVLNTLEFKVKKRKEKPSADISVPETGKSEKTTENAVVGQENENATTNGEGNAIDEQIEAKIQKAMKNKKCKQ